MGLLASEIRRDDRRRTGRARRRPGALDVFWIVGGNFLETLPDVPRSRAALSRVPAPAIHQDIVLSSAMLVEPSDSVLLLPAATRYETAGRRHGDLDGTAHHLLSRDSRPPHFRGAPRVAGLLRGRGARAAGGRRRGSASPPRARSGRRSRAPSLSTKGSRPFPGRGDQFPWGGRASLRRRPLRDVPGGQGALLRRAPAAPRRRAAPASTSRPGAANSSTRWSSARGIP